MRSSKNTLPGVFLMQVSTFYHISTIPHPWKLLERQSHNSHLKLKAYNFLRIIFSTKYPVNGKLLCKILSKAAPCAADPNFSHYEKFRTVLKMISMMESHFLVTLQVKDYNVTKEDLRHVHFTIISSYICNCNRFFYEQFIITHHLSY